MPTTISAGWFAANARAAGLAFMSVAVMMAACTPNPPLSATTTRSEPVNVGLAKLAAVDYHELGRLYERPCACRRAGQ